MTAYITAACIILGVLSLLVTLRLVFGLIRQRLATEVLKRFDKKDIVRLDLGANFFGVESKGNAQIRGNGALVLTAKTLFFLLAAPRREYNLPLTSITGLSTTKSHCGKGCAAPLLKVEYNGGDGPDAIAWAVRHTDEWMDAINELWSNAV